MVIAILCGLLSHMDGLPMNDQMWPQWVEATDDANWSPRAGNGAVGWNGHLWMFGGWMGLSGLTDIWRSDDGSMMRVCVGYMGRYTHIMGGASLGNWDRVGNGPWEPRSYYTVTITPDTASPTPTRVPFQLPTESRIAAASSPLPFGVWLMGGVSVSGLYLNDVWYTMDGTNWTITSTDGWSRRASHCAVFHDNMVCENTVCFFLPLICIRIAVRTRWI